MTNTLVNPNEITPDSEGGDDDRRSALESKFDQLMADVSDDADPLDVLDEPDHEPEPEEKLEKPKRESKPRIRDDSGKFVKTKTALESGAEKMIEQPQAQVETPKPVESPVLPPQSWAADAKEAFNQLPRNLQTEVVRRENDLRRAMQQATDKATHTEQTWSEVAQAIGQDRMSMLGRRGVTPGMAVKQLLHWQDYLDANPAKALSDLAASYGLDLSHVAQQVAQQPQEPAYVRELRQQVSQISGLLNQRQQADQQSLQQNVAAQIQAFADEKDAQGNLLRPHAEYVADDMMPQIRMIRASNPQMPIHQLLQAAYEKAIWTNQHTRELEIKKSQEVSLPSLAKAQAAAKLVNGQARSVTSREEPTDRRSLLSAKYDEAMKRRERV